MNQEECFQIGWGGEGSIVFQLADLLLNFLPCKGKGTFSRERKRGLGRKGKSNIKTPHFEITIYLTKNEWIRKNVSK